MRISAVLLAFVLAVLPGCSLFSKKDKEFKPHGTTFSLNPGVAVAALHGCDTSYSRYGLFLVALSGRSTTGGVITETLPGGLFFTASSDEIQNMLVIKRQVITFGATDTTWVIGCFCCNGDLHAPSTDDEYTVGPLTDNSDLKKIVDICADRDVWAGISTVQWAVWQVTDGSGLTSTMEDSLRALPADTMKLPRLTPREAARVRSAVKH